MIVQALKKSKYVDFSSFQNVLRTIIMNAIQHSVYTKGLLIVNHVRRKKKSIFCLIEMKKTQKKEKMGG